MKGMKGISPIIATILLLLIVIAIVGFTFGFFQNIFQTSADQTKAQLTQTNTALSKAVRIDNYGSGAVTVRNVGNMAITCSPAGTCGDLTVYVGGTSASCTGVGWNVGGTAVGSIAPNGYAQCSVACGSGVEIKVTSPTNTDKMTC